MLYGFKTFKCLTCLINIKIIPLKALKPSKGTFEVPVTNYKKLAL